MLVKGIEKIIRKKLQFETDASWIECRVSTWRQLERIFEILDQDNWLFRGQTNADWGLKTSIYRLFEDFSYLNLSEQDKYEFEQEIVRTFKANAHLYGINNLSESDTLEWLSVMQHYGAPTRMLDVSHSPYIASYFALESGEDDCAIYCFNYHKFKEIDEELFGNSVYKDRVLDSKNDGGNFLMAYEPFKTNERLLLQQGAFLVPSNTTDTFDKIVEEYGDESKCLKIVIPSSLRLEGLRKLQKMNISAATLFPGIDGFCKSLRTRVINPLHKLKRIE
ncbi:FRG domain-containing protein [Vibrio sp. CyArs1]|uniref:FRG domain-containing protein n=1 Tax=Vibrio sp. CyArs1 TaxID=2682577 RepID=UPI001F05A07C|nr:FRG domain-containing protein [Vibrio sp. CyArs1]